MPAPRCPPQSCARDDDCTQAAIPAANRSTAVAGDSAQRNHTADTPGPAHAACTREWWLAGRALTTMFMAWTSILNKCCPCEETLSPGGAARTHFADIWFFCFCGCVLPSELYPFDLATEPSDRAAPMVRVDVDGVKCGAISHTPPRFRLAVASSPVQTGGLTPAALLTAPRGLLQTMSRRARGPSARWSSAPSFARATSLQSSNSMTLARASS